MQCEARCRVAELLWRGSLSHRSLSARVKTQKMQVTEIKQADSRETDWWVKTGNNKQVRKDEIGRETKMWRKCIYPLLGDSYVLTSALCISATTFIALLAALLHTKSMGLVSASHITEATIQSSSSPGQTHKQVNLFNKPIKITTS